MYRLLALVAFALVPAALLPSAERPALAEPAPPPRSVEGPTFGDGGLLTDADLKKVTFESVRFDYRTRKPVVLVLAGVPRPYDVAVHMPRTRFREGEPIPAYFVLRNNTNQDFHIGGR